MTGWTVKPIAFAAVTASAHRKLAAELALRVDRALVTRTPKDTGHAASNWLPGVGAPNLSEVDGSSPDQALSNAQATFDPTKLLNFPLLYISNSVKYIRALNYGKPEGHQHSLKAPLHFVELAIEESRK
jgi:hypothetical protein